MNMASAPTASCHHGNCEAVTRGKTCVGPDAGVTGGPVSASGAGEAGGLTAVWPVAAGVASRAGGVGLWSCAGVGLCRGAGVEPGLGPGLGGVGDGLGVGGGPVTVNVAAAVSFESVAV